jgi:hypothetical protein
MQKENIRQNDKGDTKASNLVTQEQWWKQKQTTQEKKDTKFKTRINENHFGYLPRRKVYP